ncbi:hypothetical protein SAMN02745900_01190 [Pseudomonas sp. URIL14HWK12:I8]|uniref:hypothetical protein n=1 Tax=unclassified Pseudomonas TaxID=196821 RepID=UPI0004848B1B|nr:MULTISPECIES: hypothetical protein [unclassified Pseudomonas]SNB63644.1 hypothetical protein SAMN02745900_01190 [Pseudomonas sp. URIL14HWK12:I8]
MSDAKYVVILKGRPAPILLKASALRLEGGELRLLQGGEVVAGGPDVEFAAHMDAIPDGEIGAANLLDEPPRALALTPGYQVEPVRALELLPPASLATFHGATVSAFWPFLSGWTLGLIGGVGLTLSHVGVW